MLPSSLLFYSVTSCRHVKTIGTFSKSFAFVPQVTGRQGLRRYLLSKVLLCESLGDMRSLRSPSAARLVGHANHLTADVSI